METEGEKLRRSTNW